MLYIIDANNLAGQLKLLKENNFDKSLISIIKKWPVSQKNKIFLVFDSADPMGDKFRLGNLIIIYTPKDNYYNSADDKIIEIAENQVTGRLEKKEELIVITSDREIGQKINSINEKYGSKIKVIKSKVFAQKLIKKKQDYELNDGSRGLNNKIINNINKELLDIWQ